MSLEHSPARQRKSVIALTRPSYTVSEFCAEERMSKGKLYELWRKKKGPRFYWNGNQRRISHDARLDYQREAEAAAREAAADVHPEEEEDRAPAGLAPQAVATNRTAKREAARC
jgi:hypothetical protein